LQKISFQTKTVPVQEPMILHAQDLKNKNLVFSPSKRLTGEIFTKKKY
jgi:hypothetical protein